MEKGELVHHHGGDNDTSSPNHDNQEEQEEEEEQVVHCITTTVAEVHVQLSNLCLAFDEPSIQVSHIPLMATRRESQSLQSSKDKEEENCCQAEDYFVQPSPSFVFTKGNTHLYCVLPKPCRRPTSSTSTPTTPPESFLPEESSVVLLYKLSSPKTTPPTTHKQSHRLALPSYISAPTSTPTTEETNHPNHSSSFLPPTPPPHLYEPRVLTATMAVPKEMQVELFDMSHISHLLSNIVHVIPLTDQFMLATCSGGDMLLLTCQGKILGTIDGILEQNMNFKQGGGVRSMSVDWKENGEEEKEGRLVVVCRDGSVQLFEVTLGPLAQEVEKQDSEDSWTKVSYTTKEYSNGHANGHSHNGHPINGTCVLNDEKKDDLMGVDMEGNKSKIIQSQSHNLRLQITHLGHLPTLYDICHVMFVGYPKLAVLVNPLWCKKRPKVDADEDCRAQIWHVGLEETKESSSAVLMSELKLGAHGLLDLPHDTFGNTKIEVNNDAKTPDTSESDMIWEGQMADRFSLQRGISSNSLIVNSAVCIHDYTSVDSSKLQSFALIWDWNKCWTGYSLINAQMDEIPKLGGTDPFPDFRTGCFSLACISRDSLGFNFVHMTNLTCTGKKVYKKILSLGILSPSSCRSTSTQEVSCLLQQQNPIFCTKTMISYPSCLDVSFSIPVIFFFRSLTYNYDFKTHS